jgi:hypothetical protein
MRRFLDWVPVAIGIAMLTTFVALQWQRVVRGQNDFVALYVGAKLVGTPQIYSQTANESMIKSILGVTMETVTYTRPPFYAALLKPLAALPYLAAYGIFCGLCIFGILWFVARFYKECPALPLFAAFSIPVAAFLPQGQDTPLLLIFTGLSILLVRRSWDFLAGLVLSLCAIKFHLFLLVPLMLITKKRWRVLGGGATGTAILFVLGVAAAGIRSTGQYVGILRSPSINFSVEMMPNLHGLITGLGASASLEIGATGAVVAAFLWICQRTDDYEFLFALSLLCGLLVSYHSGVGDDILLLPVFVLIVHSSQDRPLRIALAATLSPIPYFIGVPLNFVLPALLLLILMLAAVATVPGRRPQTILPAVAT